MTPKKLNEVLTDAINHKEQLLIVGAPGIGKTDVVKQVCASLEADVIVSHPAVSDPTDYKGLPSKSSDGTHADFLPFGETWRAIEAKKLTVWFVDDLGQSSEAVQKALMQLLLGRRLNGHKLSDEIVFVGATNNVGQRSGVTGLLEPVKSRWDSIVQLDVVLDDWCSWALRNDMPAELIAFLRTRPELLSQFEPTKEIINHPSPRTWASVGRRVTRGVVDHELFSGAVGKGAAIEFLAFMDMAKDAPSLDEIILNPGKAPIPEKPAMRYLVSTGLAIRAKKDNFEKIFTYLLRLPQPFRVLTMRDAVDKDKKLSETETFVSWVVSKEGKEII